MHETNWRGSRHWCPLCSGTKVVHFLLKDCPLLLSDNLPERNSEPLWSETRKCLLTAVCVCVCLFEWRSDSRSASLFLSTHCTTCHTYTREGPLDGRAIDKQMLMKEGYMYFWTIFALMLPFFAKISKQYCFLQHSKLQSTRLPIDAFEIPRAQFDRRDNGWDEKKRKGGRRGSAWGTPWTKMMAQKREGRRYAWMGGRNGRVFDGGLCESLIPWFHQRVQIWRHLLLHEARSQDLPLTREKTGE